MPTDEENRARWGSQNAVDDQGWGAGRYYGGQSFTGGSGTEYGERMRNAAQRKGAMPVGMSLTGMQEGFDRSTQSYDQQRQALEYMKRQAAGQGPSVAAVQGQAGQDQALRAMMQRRGPMLPGNSGGLYNAANSAAAGRAKEIGQGQSGLMQGAGDLRGQSLNERGQNLATAAKYRDIGLTGQQQDMEREMALQKLALQGYSSDQSQENAMADIQLGLQGDQMQRDAQMLGMGVNAAGAGFAGVGSYFGGESGGGGQQGPKPGGYVGSNDWGSNRQGYY